MGQVASPSPGNRTPPSAAQALAALVLAGLFLLGVAGLVNGAWDGGRAPLPYVWRDVALVQVGCAVPLAWVLAVWLLHRVPALAAVALAALVLVVSLVPLPGVVRALPALGVSFSAALAVALLTGRGARPEAHGWGHTAARLGLGAAVWLVPPATYVAARCRHDLAQLGALLEQSRFAEADALARGLLLLDPGATWRGQPLPEVAASLGEVVRSLEARVARPLRAAAPASERLERARHLAMLGRTDEALAAVAPLRASGPVADVENLYATIRETTGDWEDALAAYRSARSAWEAAPPSPARAAGLLRATTGMAYCQRKVGRYAEAEASYRQVLRLSPTADSHFLLAQFYEDTQQAGKAREHARRAVALAPERYQEAGDRLVRKLSVFQFGCLGVFAAESPGKGVDR